MTCKWTSLQCQNPCCLRNPTILRESSFILCIPWAPTLCQMLGIEAGFRDKQEDWEGQAWAESWRERGVCEADKGREGIPDTKKRMCKGQGTQESQTGLSTMGHSLRGTGKRGTPRTPSLRPWMSINYELYPCLPCRKAKGQDWPMIPSQNDWYPLTALILPSPALGGHSSETFSAWS